MRQLQHRLVAEIDAGAIGDVVDHQRMRGALREHGEVLQHAALRRARVVWRRDQVSVDRPSRRLIEGLAQLRRVAAGQAEIDRDRPSACAHLRACQGGDPFQFGDVERQTLTGGGAENESIDRRAGIVRDESPQRCSIELSILEWRDEREPKAVQGCVRYGHVHLLGVQAGDGRQ